MYDVHEIDPAGIVKDDKAVQSFCQRTGATIKILLAFGNTAQQLGVSRDVTEKTNILYGNYYVQLLRSVKKDWNKIDGTVPQDQEDNLRRYTTFLKWKNNSCAEDVAIFVSLMLDAGRVQIDQLSATEVSNIKPLALLMRHIVALPWGLIGQESQEKSRHIFVELLQAEVPNCKAGAYKCILSVLEECLMGLPQLSFTTIHGSKCCDNQYMIKEGMRSVRHTTLNPSLENSRESVQQMLNHIFNAKDLPTTTTDYKCSRGHKCTKAATKMTLVVDRMPPVMAVLFGTDIKRKEGRFRKVFEEMEIQHDTTKGIRTVRYKPIGCVFYISKFHYTARWVGRGLNEGKIVHYDDMAGGNVVCYKTNDWWENIKATQGVVAVFYEQIMS